MHKNKSQAQLETSIFFTHRCPRLGFFIRSVLALLLRLLAEVTVVTLSSLNTAYLRVQEGTRLAQSGCMQLRTITPLSTDRPPEIYIGVLSGRVTPNKAIVVVEAVPSDINHIVARLGITAAEACYQVEDRCRVDGGGLVHMDVHTLQASTNRHLDVTTPLAKTLHAPHIGLDGALIRHLHPIGPACVGERLLGVVAQEGADLPAQGDGILVKCEGQGVEQAVPIPWLRDALAPNPQ